MLSMSQDQEGYRPILYKFDVLTESNYEIPTPTQMLLTFYQPEKERLSQLVGIVIIGGEPDIYDAYRATKMLTPYLESLLIEKHPFTAKIQKSIVKETLSKVSSPVKVKSIISVLETSERKEGDKLNTFFPILGDKTYHQEQLALPQDFRVHAAFIFEINDEFFTTSDIGGGIETLTLFSSRSLEYGMEGRLAFPLVVKWQPVYNDILVQLRKVHDQKIPPDFEGKVIPTVIIFKQDKDNSYTALISNISKIGEKTYFNAAVTKSGFEEDGKPLSFLISALRREKFGSEVWSRRMENQDFSEDAIFLNWDKIIDNLQLNSDGKFDIGLIRSLKRNVS
jgi:hypothetical protein